MKRRFTLFVLSLLAGAQAWAAARPGGYPTMHTEQEVARPAGVAIAGARPDQIVLYCTTLSAGCKGMRQYLRERGLDYLDKELTTDTTAQAEFEALGGLGVPLLVFKDRLLYSYYPSSFERVYAQQTSGQPATRMADTRAGQGHVAAGDKAGASAAAFPGSPVEVVPPAAIAAYLQAHPDVLVQFTSSDDRCGYCVAAYQGFDAAARVYGRAVKFVRVEWAPWQPFPKEVETLFGGVPTHIAYRNGKKFPASAAT